MPSLNCLEGNSSSSVCPSPSQLTGVIEAVPSATGWHRAAAAALPAQPKISSAGAEIPGSAGSQPCWHSRARWHHHAKDNKQLLSCQSPKQSQPELPSWCHLWFPGTSCPQRHCRKAPGEGTWADLCGPQGVPWGAPGPQERCGTVHTCVQNRSICTRNAQLLLWGFSAGLWQIRHWDGDHQERFLCHSGLD